MPRGRSRISRSPESPRRKPVRGRSPKNRDDRSSSSEASRGNSNRRAIVGRRRSPVARRKSPVRRRKSSSPVRNRRRSPPSSRSSSSSSRAKSSSRSSSSSLSRSHSSSRSGSSSASYSSSSASVSPRNNRAGKSDKQTKPLIKRRSPSPEPKKSPALNKATTVKPKVATESTQFNDKIKDRSEVKKMDNIAPTQSKIDRPSNLEVEKKSTQKPEVSPNYKSKESERKPHVKQNRSTTPERKPKEHTVRREVVETIKVVKPEVIQKSSNSLSNAIRISNLSRNVRNGHLQEIFSAYGKIKNVDLPMVTELNIPKGYAKVEFESSEEAVAAKDHMDGAQIDGNSITVDMVVLANKERSVSRKSNPKRQERSPVGVKGSPVAANRRVSISQSKRRRSSSSSSSGSSYRRHR